MKALSFLIPQKLEEVKSNYNGKIEVVEVLGKPRIIVDNLLQSGGMMELIWKKAIKKISNFHPPAGGPISNVLILGLGGGSAAQLVNQYFPKAKIIGIEIDPVVVKLGKKYFGLDKIKNLKIINQDGIKFISHHSSESNQFDLILVDLYLGGSFPKKASSKEFFKNLKKILSQRGLVIFNRLFYKEHRQLTEEFIKKLDQYFSKIELIRAWSNLLIICFV